MSQLVAPVIPETQNPVAPFLSAFLATSQIANRRRQLEDALTKMQVQSALKDRELRDRETYYSSLINLHDAQSLKDKAEAVGVVNKANEAASKSARLTALTTAIGSIDSEQGTKDYRIKLNQLRLPFADILGSSKEAQQVFNSAWNQHSSVAKQIIAGQGHVIKDFHDEMKNEKMNPYWLENPQQWDYVDANGNSTTKDKAVTRVLKLDKNMQPVAPNTKKEDYAFAKTLPVPRFDNLIDQHRNYSKVLSDIVTGAQEPDTSAAQTVQQPQAPPPPFPADPSKAVKDQPYSTPKGTLIWTGTGFRTP